MSLQETVSAERIHIAWFGRRNAGKSSLVNAVTGQDISIVSDVPGTTTDPVRKAMELLPLGPVLMIDTPGIDDEGALGELRVARTNRILAEADIAVLAVDGSVGLTDPDRELLTIFQKRNLPTVLAYTKAVVFTDVPDLDQTAYVYFVSVYLLTDIDRCRSEICRSLFVTLPDQLRISFKRKGVL